MLCPRDIGHRRRRREREERAKRAPQPRTKGGALSERGAVDGAKEQSRQTRWRRLTVAARLAAPAILGYGAIRLLGIVVLWIWAGADVWRLLGERFDASWYVGVAEHGYDRAVPVGPDGLPRTTNLAFFPLYPALIRVVGAVLPVSLPVAGLIISWLTGLVAAWGIFAVGNHLGGRRAGTLLALFWAALPHGVVLAMGYTESLFTALAAWALYAVLTRRWLTAGVLCVPAGLTRATAVALMAAVGVGALIAVLKRQDGWRPWVAVAIAPLGFLAYVGWVGQRLGRPDGWFYVQGKIWGSSFDGGRFTLRTARAVLAGPDTALVIYVVTFVLAVAVVLFALGVLDRLPWPVLAYSAVVLALVLGGAGYYHSKARLLLPAFTLLLPVALAAARSLDAGAKVRNQVATIGLLAAGSAWFGGYLALHWPYSP
jgi:hypothetical protein